MTQSVVQTLDAQIATLNDDFVLTERAMLELDDKLTTARKRLRRIEFEIEQHQRVRAIALSHDVEQSDA